MKRIVIYKGRYLYDAVNVFGEELADAFRQLGRTVEFIDLTRRETLAADLRESFARPFDFILSFGGVGCEFTVKGRSVYDLLPSPFVAVLVDHPFYHVSRLTMRNRVVTCFDRSHLRFLQTRLGDGRCGFLPHGGCSAMDVDDDGDRPMDILYAASYIDHEDFARQITRFRPPVRHVLERGVKILLNSHALPIEDALSLALDEAGLGADDERFDDFVKFLPVLDGVNRGVKRSGVLDVLDRAGIVVDVFGQGWPKDRFQNHRIHPPVPFKETLRLMRQAKLVLNTAWVPDGSHERVFSTMLNGAVCVSDQNPYLSETFEAGEEIAFYDWGGVHDLPETVTAFLADPKRRRDVVAAGKIKAENAHRWFHRAATLLELVDTH